MKSRAFHVALAAALLIPALARADGTISFNPCQPVGGTGTVTASGTFTVDSGWQATSITLYAVNPCGGIAGQSKAAIVSMSWTSSSISCLPSGTYDVFADLTLTNTCTGETRDFSTPVVSVTVN